MKKLKPLFSLVTLLFTMNVFAQSSGMYISSGEKVKRKTHHDIEIVGQFDGGIVTVRNKPERTASVGWLSRKIFKTSEEITKATHKIELEKFDAGLNSAIVAKHKLEYSSKKMGFLEAIQIGGKLYVFSTFVNKAMKKHFLFAAEVDPETMALDKNLKKVAEIDFADFNRFNVGSFEMELSPDSTVLLVACELPFKEKKSKEIGYYVLDTNLDKVWSKEVRLPFKDDMTEILDYTIDNTGNPHYLIKTNIKGKKDKKKGKVNYRLNLYSYLHSIDSLSKHKITAGGRDILSAKISVGSNNDLVVSGFTAKSKAIKSDNRRSSATGYFFQKYSTVNGALLSENKGDFTQELLVDDQTKKETRKIKRKLKKDKVIGVENLETAEIHVTEAGETFLIGEQSYNGYTYTYTSPNYNTGPNVGSPAISNSSVPATSAAAVGTGATTTKRVLPVTNDLVIVAFDEAGNAKWDNRIAKNQMCSSDFISFYSTVKNGNLYLLFNDDVKNMSYRSGSKKLRSFVGKRRTAVVAMVRINEEGRTSRRKVIINKKARKFFGELKTNTELMNENGIVYMMTKKKKNRFFKLGFGG